MPFESYARKGLLKRQKPNLKQIEKQMAQSKKDLKTAAVVLTKDPDWAEAMVYQAMLRAGRAFVYANGYLPIDGAQHRTVVELTARHLGQSHWLLTEKFEKMRRKRNLFFYESGGISTETEARGAMKTASLLIDVIKSQIQRTQAHAT